MRILERTSFEGVDHRIEEAVRSPGPAELERKLEVRAPHREAGRVTPGAPSRPAGLLPDEVASASRSGWPTPVPRRPQASRRRGLLRSP